MLLDRMTLLRWLVSREREEPGLPLSGRDLMPRASHLCGGDPAPWAAVARAVAELRRLGCVEWRYLLYPSETNEPVPHLINDRNLQQTEDIMVTPTGYRLMADRQPPGPGTQIIIGQMSVGQVALGNIQNIDFFLLLEAAEQQVEQMNVPEEVKNEARGILRKMQSTGVGIASSATGSVIAAAMRQVLGLP